MPRAICGVWSPELIRLHNVADFFIWTAYLAIPIILVGFLRKRKEGVPFRQLFLLFGAFIVACGTTHLMEIVMFYHPIYRFAGLLKLLTALVSWATVLALIPVLPRALAMRSPEVLQREIDERHRAEAQIQLLNAGLEDRVRERTAELEAANRTKDEFLMTLSHELRTPLNAIHGWAVLMAQGQMEPATHQRAVDAILRNSAIQTRLVEDILDVSRIVTGKSAIDVVPVDMLPLIANAVAAMQPAAFVKSIELSLVEPTEEVWVLGDGDRLQQVVWNLVSNAVKFTSVGGSVSVQTTLQGTDVCLDVQDSGQGITPEILPYVFERFRQADSSTTRHHGGLGLGLAIVRHLVELHGGKVTAQSPGPGLGSTFTILLPRLLEKPTTDQKAQKDPR